MYGKISGISLYAKSMSEIFIFIFSQIDISKGNVSKLYILFIFTVQITCII